ncbi:hypothetical protein HK102_001145 [Quaeritorhiza haematococci]|nr:hypothetical protein HK102_001145 [Quaeritorhiza haematococci]
MLSMIQRFDIIASLNRINKELDEFEECRKKKKVQLKRLLEKEKSISPHIFKLKQLRKALIDAQLQLTSTLSTLRRLAKDAGEVGERLRVKEERLEGLKGKRRVLMRVVEEERKREENGRWEDEKDENMIDERDESEEEEEEEGVDGEVVPTQRQDGFVAIMANMFSCSQVSWR